MKVRHSISVAVFAALKTFACAVVAVLAVFASAASGAQDSLVDSNTLDQIGQPIDPQSRAEVAANDGDEDSGALPQADLPPPGSASRASGDDTTRFAQTRLNALGYGAGREDGLPGPATRAALSRFQQDHGLEATGRLDLETFALLRLAETVAVR